MPQKVCNKNMFNQFDLKTAKEKQTKQAKVHFKPAS